VRAFGPAFVVFMSVLHSFAAAPAVVRASTVPKPGVFVLLGGGLVCLASLVRRRFSN
jgi:hypothetical protein